MINKISMLGVLAMIFFLTGCGNQNNNAEIQSASVVSTNVETQSEDGQMLNQIINYTSDGRVTMETFIHSDTEKPLPAIVVLPGGAFGMLDYPEGEPVARTFYDRGFHTFVLNYSVGEYSEFPNPLTEVSWAIWEIRSHAEEWNVDPDAIALMGFSAGSGVAGMSATQWDMEGLYESVGAPDAESVRPNAAVIGYGAADNTNTILDNPEATNPGIWGKIVTDRTPELDFVNYIDADTSPMFIWHTIGDRYVPLENPLMLASAMQEQGLPYEIHIFHDGYHGMSVGNNAPGESLENSSHPSADMWVPLCVNWLNDLFHS